MADDIDNKAFEILVREHHRRFLAYALSLIKNATLAEDIVQEALLTAYQRLNFFDTSQNFPAWVRGIIKNKYFEYCRSNNEVLLEEKDLEYLEASHTDWDSSQQNFCTDALAVLSECLKKLPETYKKAVDLFYMQELESLEVALRLSIKDTTVRKRLQRARESLGNCIEDAINEVAKNA